MPPLFDDPVGWFFKLAIAGVMSFLWWCKREDKKLLESHTKELVELRASAVTQDEVRQVVKEVTYPMIETMREIKQVVTDNKGVTDSIQIKIAEQEGFQKALIEVTGK